MERTDIVVDCENNVQDFETFCTVYLRLFRLFYIFLSVDLRTQYNGTQCIGLYFYLHCYLYCYLQNNFKSNKPRRARIYVNAEKIV